MFRDNNKEFSGSFEHLKEDIREDLMRSLSQNQVKTLVLSAESDLVKVVSTQSSYQVGNLTISDLRFSFCCKIFMTLWKMCEEDTRTSISRRIGDEDTLFGLLESQRGRSLLLKAVQAAQPRTLSRFWKHIQPVAPSFIAREDTCGLIEKLVEERPKTFRLGVNLQQMKFMMRTSHCVGLVRLIAERASDDWLIEMTKWIISNLKNVLLNITSPGPAVILEELFSKFYQISLQTPNNICCRQKGS